MPLLSNYITLLDPTVAAKPRHLAFYELGDRNNPDIVVCVHGLSRNGLDFEPLARALSAKYRVICPDMAGRGNSSWLANKNDYNYGVYCADVIALLVQLGIGRVNWIGTSMGGIIGMMIAAGNPALIKKLVLNDVGAVVSAGGLKRIAGYIGTSGTFDSEETATTYMKSIMSTWGIETDEQWRWMLEATFAKTPEGRYMLRYDSDISKPFRDAISAGVEITDIDLSAFWNVIQCPTLILRGEVSDILTKKTADAMCSRPGVTLKEIKGAGHAPALLNTEQITTIRDWLDNTRQC